MKEKWVLLRTIDSLVGFASSLIYVVVNFVLHRLKDPGRERTEARTLTATRTSSKTAVRCCVARHTRGNCLLYLRLTVFGGFFGHFVSARLFPALLSELGGIALFWWLMSRMIASSHPTASWTEEDYCRRIHSFPPATPCHKLRWVPTNTPTCTLSHCSLLIQTHRFVSGWRLQSTE